jgi:hypothetical protein
VAQIGALSAQAARWGKEYVPNVRVITQDGKVLHFMTISSRIGSSS